MKDEEEDKIVFAIDMEETEQKEEKEIEKEKAKSIYLLFSEYHV